MADVRNETAADRSGQVPSHIDEMVAEVRRVLTSVDPTAYLVQPRVLRRVMKQEWDLPTLAVNVPHRKSLIIARNNLIKHVDWDELGLQPNSDLPAKAILLAQPDEKYLESMSLAELKLAVWRLLYHARIHRAFDELVAAGKLKPASIRRRVDQLGQVEADEIATVLKREGFLRSEVTQTDVYIEFAAVFSELKRFQPHCLATYFPAFSDLDRIDELLCRDVDVIGLFEQTRLPGSVEPQSISGHLTTFEELHHIAGFDDDSSHADTSYGQAQSDVDAIDWPALTEACATRLNAGSRQNLRIFTKLMRRADKAFMRGNAVAAALLQMRASQFASPELRDEAINGALKDMQRLVHRLQAALGFNETAAKCWYESLVALLMHAMEGFWSADKKLLYDLQKVCVDHERVIYKVDLLDWALSFGQRPLKRPLPNQREVLMSKHLRSATRRLVSARLTGDERDRLSALLHAADDSAERQMRVRIRPLTEQALASVNFVPRNVPEDVAFRKLVEELLDGVVVRGFITMGDLRDAISRSNLKLEDLKSPSEFLLGDKLLQADKQLSRVLDGVYQRGDIHLRGLQRLSAAAFGTVFGRFLTRYLAIPYGCAFIAFQALLHIVEKLVDEESDFVEWISHPVNVRATIFVMGTLLLLIIHVAKFRRWLSKLLHKLFRFLRKLLIDWPARLLKLPLVRRFLKSTFAVIARKMLITPLIPTAIICGFIPWLNEWEMQPTVNWVVVWTAMAVVLNSRVGRDVEELSAEWLHRTWDRIRVHIFVALFDLVMETFKRMLEWFERVLYAVDEWLRFKSGETSVSLGFKAILSVFWSVITFVLRFCVNLLIEPQINPIKHFPVVTVSHKLLLPLAFTSNAAKASPLAALLLKVASGMPVETANAIAATVVWGIPGIFGFLVWELKSNWLVYMANRGENLKPVLVGSHGETFIRLMKPGFHSGTLPKLFAKLRRVDRHRDGDVHSQARSKYLDQLHHVQVCVQHFVERELLQLLELSGQWPERRLRVTRLRLASNSVRLEIACYELGNDPLTLIFEEQSGWLVASTDELGWVLLISEAEQRLLWRALVGFYRLAGVDLIREQIAATFASKVVPYDVAEAGLLVWPDGEYEEEAIYGLNSGELIRPYPRHIATKFSLPIVHADSLIFALTPVSWQTWSEQWDSTSAQKSPVLPDRITWPWPVEAR